MVMRGTPSFELSAFIEEGADAATCLRQLFPRQARGVITTIVILLDID